MPRRSPPVVAFDADVLGRSRGGDETVARELLRALGRVRAPFRILAYVRDADAVPADAVASGVVHPVEVAVGSNYARVIRALPRQLRIDDPDLYHGNYVLPPGLRCRSVVTVHDCSFLRIPESMPWHDRLAFSRFVPWSVRRADRVVAVSEFTRRDLLDLVPGLDPVRVVVVPNAPAPEFASLARGVSDVDGPYVLAIGTLTPRKNLERLLEAWATLKLRRPGPEKLLLVGSGPLERRLDDLAARLGVADSVERRPHMADQAALARLIANARVLAAVSLYEGFGLPVVEAMAAGTPVVCSDSTALPEVGGEAARYVDALSPTSIATGLAAILGDPNEARRMVERGREQASRYTWDRSAMELIEVYEDVLRRKTSRSVGLSVVSTRETHLLGDCFAAVDASVDTLPVMVTCVANAPGDGTVELVSSSFPDVQLLVRDRTMSFAANNNDAIARGNDGFVMVMNADVTLDPPCLARLIAWMDANPRCGLAVPYLRNVDGSYQPSARRWPEPVGSLVRRTPLRNQLPAGSHYLDEPTTTRPIDWALGACLLLRREAWEDVGGFDTDFAPIYVEDIDLAWRLSERGWETWQVADARATHAHQAVSDKRLFSRRAAVHWRNMARFVRRHPRVLVGARPRQSIREESA